MPRTGTGSKRGGPRVGTPGTAYGQRTDLNSQPVQAPSGDTYGDQARYEQAQQALPLPQAPTGPAPIAGELGSLGDPTQMPDQPITSGVDIGAGAGSSALTTVGQGGGVSALESAATRTGDPFLMRLVMDARKGHSGGR